MGISIYDILDDSIKLLEESDVCKDQLEKLLKLREKLKNKEIIISVVGQFKRGKTTFINKVLGDDILPVAIIPITSVVTRLQYSPTSCAKVIFKNGEEKEVPLDNLSIYISEQENPNNQKEVEYVKIFYPSSILKEGIILVDTPGVGSIHKHNTDAAYSFIKNSDAIIFMLSVDSPINEIEREFLSAAKKYASKFYFVINKIDVINSSELETYLKYCENVICEIMNINYIDFFPISAQKLIGVEKLISIIKRDVNHSKDEIIVNSIKIKTTDILKTVLSKIQLYISALKMPIDSLEEKIKELYDKLKELDRITEDIFYHAEKNTDNLIQNIEEYFKIKVDNMVSDMEKILKDEYEKNNFLRPRKLEEKLKYIIDSSLVEKLESMNEEGLEKLKIGYENIIEMLNNDINDIKSYISKTVYDIFNVEYSYEKNDYILSNKEDFYVEVDSFSGSFFININDFVYIMPKSYSNRIIYQKLLDNMKRAIERNKNNMLYNYRYKIQESLRSFKLTFTEDSSNLQRDIQNTLNKVILNREDKNMEVENKIKKLNSLCENIEDIVKNCYPS
ncbi:dynamin family protein [Caloramator sp. E03]|uniref:dynamin family protein n=1 Tax=Caloramator sp. E03 TaxID=2576307 RepID=UPI00143D3D2F|nr:dynamin family protein [Caloramator sp. E03]